MSLAAAKQLILAIAPELAAAPLYVVPLPPSESLRGFCSRRVEAAYRDQLAASGEWQGPGTLIAISGGLDLESTIGVALHEAAHALPFAPPAVQDYTPTDVARAHRLLSAVASLPDEPPQPCPWHGSAFIRTCCHLQHRAAASGVELPFPAIFEAWRYQTSPLVQFARALGDEPENMIGETFATILATEPPSEFTNLCGA